jgi:hypothetical protein
MPHSFDQWRATGRSFSFRGTYRALVPKPDVISLPGIGHYPHVEDAPGVQRALESAARLDLRACSLAPLRTLERASLARRTMRVSPVTSATSAARESSI